MTENTTPSTVIYQVKARDINGNHIIKGSYSDKAQAYHKADEITAQGIYQSVYIVPIDPKTGRIIIA
ncbi:hypothetical protein F544_20690 [Bibersteinia trehalosi USDA-ARS-USMARC-190]|uniref:SPOR domain-containing protein n=1 Tax=Bibersteinia trehalosi USDA-ARS-USMARC-190 TaxID=1263832 RepID=W0RA31_BIBTR|nr:hypothetical protein [Bibersteinia trehalosi]AHG87297.1 hypothetical protein F544_20690 [Bibersteinia trehalosi USDA-ARS-USMARC-190]